MEPPSFQLESLQPGVHDQPPFPQPRDTRLVPVTRPPGTTSRSNSPGYPRWGALPHAGGYPTLTHTVATGFCIFTRGRRWGGQFLPLIVTGPLREHPPSTHGASWTFLEHNQLKFAR
jgi:hypothetical protein